MIPRVFCFSKVIFTLLFFYPSILLASTQTLAIATIERPPFSIKTEQGQWTGFSIELIEEIAKRKNLKFELIEETVFSRMLDDVVSGKVNLAVANVSVTADRELVMDFSQPIYRSGLQILASPDQAKVSFFDIIWQSGIWLFLGGALIVLLIVAHLMWFFERGEDAKHDYFRDEYLGGIWDAFWWAFVICTMGGFEKERPEHLIGRIIAVFWVLASLFFISTLTAKITSALTVSQLNSGISSYQDLHGKKVGAPKGTTISQFLDKNNIPYIEYDDFNLTLIDLENNKLDAVVGDAAVSRYYAQTKGNGKVAAAGDIFSKDNIAFAFTENSPVFEVINGELLKMQEDGFFDELQEKYFGR